MRLIFVRYLCFAATVLLPFTFHYFPLLLLAVSSGQRVYECWSCGSLIARAAHRYECEQNASMSLENWRKVNLFAVDSVFMAAETKDTKYIIWFIPICCLFHITCCFAVRFPSSRSLTLTFSLSSFFPRRTYLFGAMVCAVDPHVYACRTFSMDFLFRHIPFIILHSFVAHMNGKRTVSVFQRLLLLYFCYFSPHIHAFRPFNRSYERKTTSLNQTLWLRNDYI